MIATSGLTKTFRTEAGDLRVLRDVNLRVPRGQMAAIVGASGVGKSTLLHILGTLDRPTSGAVTIDGTQVFGLGERELAAFRNTSIGFVFQFHHLMPEFSTLENVTIPALISGRMSREDASKYARRLLDRLGVHDREGHRPGELSGGEQQRVAVARALMLNPRVVLADEPTGNLDSQSGEDLFGLLSEINRESSTTFVIVTHNMDLAARCHRIIRMSDGSVLQD